MNIIKKFIFHVPGGDDQTEADGSGINSKVLELKLKALILDTIHHISIVEELIDSKVRSVDDWLWKKQLRFYMNKQTNTATISMVDADFDYTYEYQGNASKLVHTPLTDKCYLTLTQGMRVGLGGNPYGPAGSCNHLNDIQLSCYSMIACAIRLFINRKVCLYFRNWKNRVCKSTWRIIWSASFGFQL